MRSRLLGGERAMAANPEEFREFAQECLHRADETQSERHRLALIETAKTWFQAALEVERRWEPLAVAHRLTPPRAA